jgi:hypothetical protein
MFSSGMGNSHLAADINTGDDYRAGKLDRYRALLELHQERVVSVRRWRLLGSDCRLERVDSSLRSRSDSEHVLQHNEQHTRQHDRRGQRQYPGHQQIAHGGPLQS